MQFVTEIGTRFTNKQTCKSRRNYPLAIASNQHSWLYEIWCSATFAASYIMLLWVIISWYCQWLKWWLQFSHWSCKHSMKLVCSRLWEQHILIIVDPCALLFVRAVTQAPLPCRWLYQNKIAASSQYSKPHKVDAKWLHKLGLFRKIECYFHQHI